MTFVCGPKPRPGLGNLSKCATYGDMLPRGCMLGLRVNFLAVRDGFRATANICFSYQCVHFVVFNPMSRPSVLSMGTLMTRAKT